MVKILHFLQDLAELQGLIRGTGIHAVGKESWKKREVGKVEMKLEGMKLESSSRSRNIFDYLILH